MLTQRLEVRQPQETDRERFVELFRDAGFMEFSGGALSAEAAGARFDAMLERSRELPFAKQPVIEPTTGLVVGYSGVDWFHFEGERRLEFGYRLVPGARGRGYATEAGRAVLDLADDTYRGEILAIIHPGNAASTNVAVKLGFRFWKRAPVDGELREISRRQPR